MPGVLLAERNQNSYPQCPADFCKGRYGSCSIQSRHSCFCKAKRLQRSSHPISADGKKFVPALVPYWKHDKPVCNEAINAELGIVATIKKGQIVELKKALSAGHKPGRYIVTDFGQVQVVILPDYMADNDDARIGFGLPKTGIKPRWNEFVSCLGYELPHPPSVKPQSESPHQA